MNKKQKEVQQSFLNSEKEVLDKLTENYQDALDEIENRIAILQGRNDADLQHVIYQVEYQKSLKSQVQAILTQLQNNNFETLSEYLATSYEDGFIGTMYDLQGQGIPLVFPIDQEQVVAAIQHETKLSENLYSALGLDTKVLSKQIAGEISRGISNSAMYSEMARNIAGYCGISKNKAMRIARTEAHRIQCQATSDAQWKAKEKGADVVKQWDASLDGKTRQHHRQLDGQIRELDEPFEVAGKTAMQPGGFGIASEDINCRCALLQRARWALGDEYTKWSPDAPVEISDDGTTQLLKVDAKDFTEFKGYYQDITGQMTMNMTGGNSASVKQNVPKIKSPISARNTARGKPSAISQFEVSLNSRQQKLLDELQGYNSSVIVNKSDVNMTDLSALTASTGSEFAMFTNGSRRLIIRGNESSVDVTIDIARNMAQNGYKWSGHTHPGYDYNCLIASGDDYEILKAFGQNQSVTYNSLGQYLTYELGD